MHTNVIIEWNT